MMQDQPDAIEIEVMRAVHEVGDPLLRHVVKRCPQHPADAVEEAVRGLVQRGDLRMKDDDIDHEWAYRMTSQGRRRFGYENGGGR